MGLWSCHSCHADCPHVDKLEEVDDALKNNIIELKDSVKDGFQTLKEHMSWEEVEVKQNIETQKLLAESMDKLTESTTKNNEEITKLQMRNHDADLLAEQRAEQDEEYRKIREKREAFHDRIRYLVISVITIAIMGWAWNFMVTLNKVVTQQQESVKILTGDE